MQDHQTSIPLESTSEFYLYGETGPYRSVGMVSILLEGVLDLGKMTQAVETALDHFPALSSTLKEERNGWMYSLFWAPSQTDRPPLYQRDLSRHPASGQAGREAQPPGENPATPQSTLQAHFAERLEKGFDVRREAPTLPFLIRLGPTLHSLGAISHHAAADAGAMFEFFKLALALYHQAEHGQLPSWSEDESAASSIPSQAPTREHTYTRRRFIWESLHRLGREAIHPPYRTGRWRSGLRNIRHQCSIKLTADEVATLRRWARNEGGTLNDLLLAASGLALQEDAQRKGQRPNRISLWTVVNLRGRLNQKELNGNLNTTYMIDTLPRDRANLTRLLRRVTHQRQAQQDQGWPVANFRALQRLGRYSRILPLRLRMPILRPLIEAQYSVVLSNVGVLWPEMRGGRPTGRSFLERSGDLNLVGIGIESPPLRRPAYHLVSYTFLGTLHLDLTWLDDVLRPEESQAILDGIESHLRSIL